MYGMAIIVLGYRLSIIYVRTYVQTLSDPNSINWMDTAHFLSFSVVLFPHFTANYGQFYLFGIISVCAILLVNLLSLI